MHDTVAESWTRLGECFGDLFASYGFLLVPLLKSPFFSFQFRPAVILAWKVRGSSQGKNASVSFGARPISSGFANVTKFDRFGHLHAPHSVWLACAAGIDR